MRVRHKHKKSRTFEGVIVNLPPPSNSTAIKSNNGAITSHRMCSLMKSQPNAQTHRKYGAHRGEKREADGMHPANRG